MRPGAGGGGWARDGDARERRAGGDTAVGAVGERLESGGKEEGGREWSRGEHGWGGGVEWANGAEGAEACDSRRETTTATVVRHTADELTPPAHVHEERVMEQRTEWRRGGEW